MSAREIFEIEDSRDQSDWLRHWDWLFVLSIAWLVFDLFMQPVLSIVIASVKFGWNDFANGFWLWRKDRDFRRGRAFALFYAATGLWRITVTTFAITTVGLLIIGFVMAAIQAPGAANAPGNDGSEVAAVSMIIVTLCFVLSSLCTWVAMGMALKNRVRVWIDATVRYSRRRRLWPPEPNGKNQLSRVVTSSLIFQCVVVCGFTLYIFVKLMNRGGPVPGAIILLPTITVILCAFLLLPARVWLLKKLAASSPQECWAGE